MNYEHISKKQMWSWLSDLNSALNVLRTHNYNEHSISYAEDIHARYHKEINHLLNNGQEVKVCDATDP